MAIDLYNIDTDAAQVYQQYTTFSVSVGAVNISGGTAVVDINGLSGPVINFVGGTSGFSYSTTAPSTITLVSPLTTKGDLYTRNTTDGVRLGVGTNGFVLTADSGEATGLKWAAGTSGTDSLANDFLLMGA
jgi:hypothetical protein